MHLITLIKKQNFPAFKQKYGSESYNAVCLLNKKLLRYGYLLIYSKKSEYFQVYCREKDPFLSMTILVFNKVIGKIKKETGKKHYRWLSDCIYLNGKVGGMTYDYIFADAINYHFPP